MIHLNLRKALAAFAMLVIAIPATSFACSMTSNPEVTIALGDPAPHLVDPDEILEGTPSCPGPYTVTVFNTNGTMRLDPIIDCDDVGKRLLVKVTASTGNSVWSYVRVEDNLKPVVTATNVTVTCVEDIEAAGLAAITYSDNCTAPENLSLRITSIPSSVGCSNGIAQTFIRSIFVIDEAGNRSATVPQTITVTRVDIADVMFPPSITYLTSDTTICPADFGYPAIQYPTVNGMPISAACKILTTVEDEELNACGASRKILRTFQVLDCCTNQIRNGFQVITIMDDQAPILLTGVGQELPDTLNAINLAGNQNCTGTSFFPPITAVDSCSSTPLSYLVRTPFGSINTNGGQLNATFPLLAGAPFDAIYEVHDACGNVVRDTIVITREDTQAPTAICDEITTVSLATASTTIPAINFDDGSFDNCGIDSFTVRRMGDIAWLNEVTVTCDDVLDTVLVEFRVTDFDGNSNICMVQVIVEDKSPASVNPLPTLTFTCIRNPVDTFFSGVPTVNEVCVGGYQLDTIINDDSMLQCRTGTSKRKFIFTNAAGEMIMTTQMINYVDSGMFTIPTSLPDTVIDCSVPVLSLPTRTFNTDCDVFAVNSSFSAPAEVLNCSTIVFRVTYNFMPLCGNGAGFTLDRNITQVDNQAPVWDPFPGDLDSTYACALPGTVLAPTATDACGTVIIDRFDSVVDSSSANCPYLINTYKYVARDFCGNENPDTITRVIRLRDDAAPIFGTIDEFIVDCKEEIRDTLPAYMIVSNGITDNCPGAIDLRIIGNVVDTADACVGSIVRTYLAIDACGNSSTASQTITYDHIGQTLLMNVLPNITNLQCYDDVLNYPNPTAAELGGTACDTSLLITNTFTDPSLGGCPETVVRTYAVTDDCGNTGTITQSFTFNDTTPPVISTASDLTVQCESNVPSASTTIASITATDNCELIGVTTEDTPLPGNTDCAGTIVRTYTATDACGNAASSTQSISWNGDGALSLTALSGNGIVYDCVQDIIAAPQVTDPAFFGTGVCSTALQIDSVTHSPNTACGGNVTRTYFIQDECGNMGTVTQNFIFVDFVAPTISGVVNLTVDCASDIPDTTTTKLDLTVTENCAGRSARLNVLSDVVTSMGTCMGSLVRTYIATDACGNTSTATQTISYDQTNITLELEALDPVTDLECYIDVVAFPSPTLTVFGGSGCSGSLNITSTTSGPDPGTCSGTVIRTYQVTDDCGNTASVTQSFSFNDMTPPSIDGQFALEVDCFDDVPNVSTSIAALITSDNCGTPTVTADSIASPGSTVCFGSITRIYTASDGCGNTASITQNISWNQDGNLMLNPVPSDGITYQCYQDILAVDTISDATFFGSGICGTDLMVSSVSHSADPGCTGTVTRTYSIEDGCQNTGTVEQTFMLNDPTAPTFTGVMDTTILCRADLPSAQTTSANISTTDNCTGRLSTFTVTSTVEDSNNTPCSGFWIRTYTATDACSNTSTATQMITYGGGALQLNNLPEFPDTFLCYQDVLDFNPLYTTGQFGTGACGTALSFVGTPTNSANPGCSGNVIRTFMFEDGCGNTGTATQTFVVKDTTGPTLTRLGAELKKFENSCGEQLNTLFARIANQPANCNSDPSTMTFGNDSPYADNPNSLNASGRYPATNDTLLVNIWATDVCGNSDTTTYKVLIIDTQIPTAICGNIEISLDANGADTLTVADIEAQVSGVDNCHPNGTGFFLTPLVLPDTTFDCSDFQQPIFYEYMVQDTAGNADVCMGQILVDNVPQIDCRTLQFRFPDLCSDTIFITEQMLIDSFNIVDACQPGGITLFSNDFFEDLPFAITSAQLGVSSPVQLAYSITAENASSRTSECDFLVEITHACNTPPMDPFALAGRVDAPLYGGVMDSTLVTVIHDGGSLQTYSDVDGYYSFVNVPSGSISLSAKLPMKPSDRVTTYDMLRIGQHLLGVQPFEDPFLLLAADVNKSGGISAFDLTAIRRVILGQDAAFGGEHEMATLGAYHPFSDTDAPWADSQNWGTHFSYVGDDMMSNDLSVVKLGDINPTTFLLPRGASELELEDRFVEAGETVDILVRNDYESIIAGLQLSIIANGQLDVSAADDNIDLHSNSVQGALRISIVQELLQGEPVMTWTFTPTESGMLSELIKISNDIPNESYLVEDNQPSQLALHWKATNVSGSLAEINAFPNPFDNHLAVSAHLTKEGKHVLRVSDMTGRSFAERRIEVAQDSWHNFRLDTDEWPAGVFILTLEGPTGQLTQRVVLQR